MSSQLLIRFRCGSCDRPFQIDQEHAGRRIKCPDCSTVFRVPNPSVQVATPTALSTGVSVPALPPRLQSIESAAIPERTLATLELIESSFAPRFIRLQPCWCWGGRKARVIRPVQQRLPIPPARPAVANSFCKAGVLQIRIRHFRIRRRSKNNLLLRAHRHRKRCSRTIHNHDRTPIRRLSDDCLERDPPSKGPRR